MDEVSEHSDYFKFRLTQDLRRSTTWEALCEFFFNKIISESETVLELGAGYCDFINNVKCEKKIAVDQWQGFSKFAAVDVETHVADVINLESVISNSVDTILCSNLLEHLSQTEVSALLNSIKLIMSPENGKLILVQPNFRLNPGRYFDDYTHVSIWTDVSMCDFLESHGFEVVKVMPKFLPLSLKSKLPVFRSLIWLYLKLPMKFKAGQMLIIAKPND
jgi:hypothetical protein